jgi:hypothetical protein
MGSISVLAVKILSVLTATERLTYEQVAVLIGEDPLTVGPELQRMEYQDKVLSELVGSPIVRTYRLDGRKKAPRCPHAGPFAVASLVNMLGGLLGKTGEEGAHEPNVLCMSCGATRHRHTPDWSQPMAFYMSDPIVAKYGLPEGAAIVVHATGLRAEEVDAAAKSAWEWWVDLDFGRRWLWGRLCKSDVERAEKQVLAHLKNNRESC